MNEFSKSEANPNVRDVLMTVPVQLIQSSFFPFGDGQSNSHLTYGPYWQNPSPVVILKREIYQNGSLKDSVIWNPSLGLSNDLSTMDFATLGSWIFFKPKGWDNWFVGSFAIEIYNISSVSQSFPAIGTSQKFPDPEKIISTAGTIPFTELQSHRWSNGYNSTPYVSDNVHGVFPVSNNQSIQTAVGGVLTWVINRGANVRYKHLYTCFDARKIDDEARAGAPTGAGWHHIGDPAETILNSLESTSLPVAVAYAYNEAQPQANQLAFGLSHVVIVKKLHPGEMFLTRSGSMHWYVNPNPTPFCNEIIVHNCEPDLNNNWGIDCK